jgi:hypothetical protein
MPSGLAHRAVMEDQDAIRPLDRGEPMRDDHAGPPGEEPRQRLADQGLGLRIDTRRRFVERQDARIIDERAGDGEMLALPATDWRRARRSPRRSRQQRRENQSALAALTALSI